MTITPKTIMKPVTVYTYNGVDYATEDAAKEAAKNATYRDEILKKFSPVEMNRTDYYVIEDEGPIDYGSSGRPRVLGYALGRPREVVDYALTLPGFIGYGPGSIRKIDIKILGS